MILFLYFFTIFLVNINCHDYTPEYTTVPGMDMGNEIDVTETQSMQFFDLVRGSSVDMWVSPENVVYCKLIGPRGSVFYDYFGRCRLSLDRVDRLEHHGHWDMQVGYPGSAILEEKLLYFNVIEREPKTKVQTELEEFSTNIVTMTCSLPSRYQVQGCKFRGPSGLTFLAYGTTATIVKKFETEFETRLEGSACSLQITDPRKQDLGFWRCAMYTEQDTYYGFVTVLSTWFLNDTSLVQTIRRGPLLRVDHGDIRINEGEPVTMSCSIDAPIRYCYFWKYDGTIFNVSPGFNSSSMEYVGSGFDAGECGLKLYNLNYSNSGWRWSCNVGVAAVSQQSRDFFVFIRDRMEVSQESYGSFDMRISGRIVDKSQLEYCRYIQDDGFGFSYDNSPSRYEFVGSLSEGSCDIRVNVPDSWADYRPWTIIAKIKGEDEEISGRTWGLPQPSYRGYGSRGNGWRIFGWVSLGVVSAVLLLGVVFGPQRSRQAIQRRTTIIRESLRRQPPPPYTPAT